MHLSKYADNVSNLKAEITFLRMVILVLSVGLLVTVALAFKVSGKDRIVVTPPEIEKSFWVSQSDVSKEYLEQMAYWYVGLALNVSPGSADYQNEQFLKYAAPSEAGHLQVELNARTDKMKNQNLSTQFTAHQVTVDTSRMLVSFNGSLVTWATDKKAGERSVTYVIRFQYMNGRLYVSDFKEASDQDPFGDRAAATAGNK